MALPARKVLALVSIPDEGPTLVDFNSLPSIKLNTSPSFSSNFRYKHTPTAHQSLVVVVGCSRAYCTHLGMVFSSPVEIGILGDVSYVVRKSCLVACAFSGHEVTSGVWPILAA